MKYVTTKFQDFEIREYEILDSSNEEAKRILAENPNDNLVIVSLMQTAGKGRNSKEWISDEGNLFFTIIINSAKFGNPELSSFISSLAVSETIEDLGIRTQIKWPNDVLISGKKFCGILIENLQQHLIIGIGININSCPVFLDNKRTATCLKDHVKKIEKEKIFTDILDNFSKILEQYKKEGFEPIRKKIIARLYKLNETVELDYLGKKLAGKIIDISPEGNLVIRTINGIEEYKTGEIFA